jgi:predicted transcriptional regulator
MQSSTTAAQIMRPLSSTTTIAPQASLTEVLSKMSQAGIGRLLVVQEATVCGMITKTGLLRFLEIEQILDQSGPKEPASWMGNGGQ